MDTCVQTNPPSLQTQLAKVGQPIVEGATRLAWARSGGRADLSELRSWGFWVLCRCTREFDSARGEFEPYLRQRLRWTMADLARRGAARNRRARELPWHCGEDDDTEVDRRRWDPWAAALLLRATRTTPETLMNKREGAEAVRELISMLPCREREVVNGFYIDEIPLRELATQLDLSASYLSRIHRRALLMLRRDAPRVLN